MTRAAGKLALVLLTVAAVSAEELPPGADLRLGFVAGYLQDPVRRISFTPGGETCLASGWKRAAFFATEDGAPQGVLPTSAGARIKDSQQIDGGSAALVVVGPRAVALQRETGWEHFAFGGDDLIAQAARLSPRGGLVAVGGQRRNLSDDERVTLVRVLARDTGQLVHELEMAGRGVADMAFSPSDDALVVASRDAFLRLFDMATGVELHRYGGRALEPHLAESEADRIDASRVDLEFHGVAFSPGGGEVLGLALRHSLSRWRRRDGGLLMKIEATAPGAAEGVDERLPVESRRVGMDFFAASPDGVRALVYSQELKLLNLSSGEVERTLEFPAGVPTAAAFTPDGRSVVVGGTRGLCFRYQVDTGEIVGRDREVRGAVVTLVARPGAGEVLAGDFGFLRRWRISDGMPVGRSMEHGAPVGVLAAAPDGARAVTGGGPPGVKVWTLGSDRLEVEPELSGDEVAGAAFLSPTRLLLVGRSGTARVYDLPQAAPVEEFATGEGAAKVAFGPEQRLVAMIGVDHLRVYDLVDRREVARYPFSAAAKGMAVAPDGRTVAVGLAKRDEVLRYDVYGGPMDPLVLRKMGEEIPTRHRDDRRPGTWEVAFTPEGDRLVARSAGRALQVWQLPAGRRLGHVEGSVLNEVTGLLMDGRGDRVISGAGKVAYRWLLKGAR